MPTDPPALHAAQRHPARVMLDSPLAAATRAGILRRRSRQPPRPLWRRVSGLVGALLIHLLFLFGFVLGPAYELKLPPPPTEEPLQVRLIELPELPPPPAVRGTPPREVGPRHQGHAAVSPRQPRAAGTTARAVMPPAVIVPSPSLAPPVPTAAVPAAAAHVVPVPPAPTPTPTPTPTPQPPAPQTMQPIAVADLPPVVTQPKPEVPPPFQPEPVRPAQIDGNQPALPPASLALPKLPAHSVAPISAPALALDLAASKPATPPPLPTPARITSARITPARITPAHAQAPVATPAAQLQAIPLAAPGAPRVVLQTAIAVAAPAEVRALPRVTPVAVQPQTAPAADTLPSTDIAQQAPQPAPPALKVAVADSPTQPTIEPVIERPALATAPGPAASSHAEPAAPEAGVSAVAPDSSRAPDAIAQGTDDATLGNADGTVSAAATPPVTAASPADTSAAGRGKDAAPAVAKPQSGRDSQRLGGLPAGDRPGAEQGASHGARQGEPNTAPGGYVQLTPQGDTRIMRHGAPDIGYKPTRFDKDWTPDGESSVDTALRRAIEKTTVKHTFHLPRGVRVECAVRPLLPVALFGCRNPDPPAVPVAQKVYDRLHLPTANPLLPSAPASAAPAATAAPAHSAPIHLDNSALCATAHIAGGPPPPGCETVTLPVKLAPAPASSSSRTWVPASDQFH